jgi:hypothetical protein
MKSEQLLTKTAGISSGPEEKLLDNFFTARKTRDGVKSTMLSLTFVREQKSGISPLSIVKTLEKYSLKAFAFAKLSLTRTPFTKISATPVARLSTPLTYLKKLR